MYHLRLLLFYCIVSSSFIFLQSFVWWPLSTPFWDQWEAEFGLLTSYIAGDDLSSIIFTPHNEHYIVLHKLLILIIYMSFGIWSVELEKIWIIILQAITFIVLARGIIRFTFTNRATNALILLLLSMYYSHPLHWENFLFGFQAQIFMHVLCVVCSVVYYRPEGSVLNDIIIYVFLLCSFLSFAAGIVATAVFLYIYILRSFRRSLRTTYALSTSLYNILIVLVYIITIVFEFSVTPYVAGHASLRPTSFIGFMLSLDAIYSFPLSRSFFVFPIISILVSLYGTIHNWHSSDQPAIRVGWLLLVYATGTSLLIVLGRGSAASRYNWQLMYLVLGVMFILYGFIQVHYNKYGYLSLRDIFAILCALLLSLALIRLPADYSQAERRWRELALTDEYFKNGIPSVFEASALLKLYPDHVKLSHILRSTAFFKVVPFSMRASLLKERVSDPLEAWIRNGVYPTTPHVPVVYGSYNSIGDSGIGCLTLFSGLPPSNRFYFSYAGYPQRMLAPLIITDTLSLHSEKPMFPDSGESWSSIFFTVNIPPERTITIEACDDNSLSWWAISNMKYVTYPEYIIQRFIQIMGKSIWVIISVATGVILMITNTRFAKEISQ